MKIRISNKLYNDIALFLILFLSGGFVVANDIISSGVTIGLWLLTLLFIMRQIRTVRVRMLATLGVLIISLWLSVVINSEDIRRNFMITVSLIIVCLYANVDDFDVFRERYISVIYALAWISLIGFAVAQMFPKLLNYNLVQNAGGRWASNWWIYVQQYGISRNQGMYVEPGMYQTFLNLALLFELTKKRVNFKRVLVLIVAIITTFSTTGFLGASLILLAYALFNPQQRRMKILLLVFVVLGFVIYAMGNYSALFSTSSNTVFGKIIRFFQEKEYDGNKATSATIRYFGIIKVAQAFLESPVWGWGYQGLNEKLYAFTHNMNTCTFINWYAVYGIGYGIVMTFGMLRVAQKLATNRWHAALVMITLFVLTMSENYVSNAAVTMIAIYGFKEENEVINEDSLSQQL